MHRKQRRPILTKAAALSIAGILAVTAAGCGSSGGTKSGSSSAAAEGTGKTVTLTNVSYDPTRELYQAYNKKFAEYYKEKTGTEVKVVMSHGGSGSQARSVVEGADADVVTLALAHDVELVQQAGLIDAGWEKEFSKDSSPYTSSIVLLVRKGNPKKIKDWDDLIRSGVDVITPDPKSSGGACWNFLAAWNYAMEKYGSDESKAKNFVKKLYANVTVMDSGARGATTTFVENGQGDVLVAWENEALATVKEYPDQYEIISPSISILAQPSVAVVDSNAEKDGVTDAAKEYLDYLYSKQGQELVGTYGYRPSDKEVLKKFSDKFDLHMKLCTVNDFGGWDKAYEKFFEDGGIFDEIYQK